jgi:hypothetical protein
MADGRPGFVTLLHATKSWPPPPSLWWRVTETDAGGVRADLGGELDENADLAELRRALRGPVVLHLAEVHRINSCGVREWVNFMRELQLDPRVTSVDLEACSPPFVSQLNTISNFRGAARVRSLLAPYVCERCNVDENHLVVVAAKPLETELPDHACPRCGGVMEFDELPERYLAFLRELT